MPVTERNMARPKGAKDAEGPERMCVACRERHAPGRMVRFVVAPDGRIVIDVRQRAPGRGAWLMAEPACVELAVKRRALQRALSGHLVEPDAEALLAAMRGAQTQRALDRLGLARRAGRVATGTNAVRDAMRAGEARLVWIARDASDGTRVQLAQNAERKEVPVVIALEGAALARAVGRDFVAAVAVTGEPFASELIELSSSLEDFSRGSRR